MKKGLMTLFNILILVALGIALAFGIMAISDAYNYKKPINNFYKGLEKRDTSLIAKAYLPCLAKEKAFMIEIDNKILPLKRFKDPRITYVLVSKKKMSKEMLKDYQEKYKMIKCDVSTNIDEAIIATVKTKQKLTNLLDEVENTTEIPVGKFAGKWYILQ